MAISQENIILRLQTILDGGGLNDAKKGLSDVEKQSVKTEKRFNKLSKVFAGVFAAAAVTQGISQLRQLANESVELFKEQERAENKVKQAIISTNNAAGLSFKELQKAATDLQNNTIFGDEEILNNATAQLLTFTNITGENFERTQKVALDLATVLDGDLKSASIQLGKALNDPVANLSALSRSGIQFSDSQKETIKQLAETNQLAAAQNVILKELERQYGGQAAAAAEGAGKIQQLNNAIGDQKELIGEQLIPAQVAWKRAQLAVFNAVNRVIDGFKVFGFIAKEFRKSVRGIKDENLKLAGATRLAADEQERLNRITQASTESTKDILRIGELSKRQIEERISSLNESIAAQEDFNLQNKDLLSENVKRSEDTQKRIREINDERIRLSNQRIGATKNERKEISKALIELTKEYNSINDQAQRFSKQNTVIQGQNLDTLIRQRSRFEDRLKELNAIKNPIIRIAEDDEIESVKEAQTELEILRGELSKLQKKLGEDIDSPNFIQGVIDDIKAAEKELADFNELVRLARIDKVEVTEISIDSKSIDKVEGDFDFELATDIKIKPDPEATKTFSEQFNSISNDIISIQNTVTGALKGIFDLQEAELDRQIELQEKRVNAALGIARFGNAELLQAEKQRLAKLEAEREKAVKRQQALAKVELITNSLLAASQTVVAITSTAAQSGVASIGTVPAVIAAIAAGLGIVGSLVAASLPTFHEGTEFVDAKGSHVTDGKLKTNEVLAKLEKGERVLPRSLNRQLKGISNAELVEGFLLGGQTLKPMPVLKQSVIENISSKQDNQLIGEMKKMTTELKAIKSENIQMKNKLDSFYLGIGFDEDGNLKAKMDQLQAKEANIKKGRR